MKHILITLFAAFLCMPAFGQKDNPVVMTVNGNEVRLSEFEYFIKKNNADSPLDSKTIKQYADLYLNFKLKVQAAMDEGMDKSESFLSEFKTFRDIQAQDYLVDTVFLEDIALDSYRQSLQEIGPDGLAYLSVLVITPEQETLQAYLATQAKMDSIYGLLENGAYFPQLVRKYADPDIAETEGHLGWLSRGVLPKQFADSAFSYQAGEYCHPFEFEGSFFIINVDLRRDLGDYESNRDEIYRWMESEGNIYPEAKRRKANSYADSLGWTVRDDEAVACLDSMLEELDPEFCNISREYHDGLLMFEINSREVWEKAATDSEGLEAFFQSQQKKRVYNEPYFKGMVFFCTDESVFQEIESILKDADMSEWVDKILAFNKEKIRIRVMKGNGDDNIFRKGQNEYVDKIVFGQGEFQPMAGYPYANVIGKKYDRPESVADAPAQLNEDYQKHLEDQWVNSLRKKYKYKIYKKALRKVSLDK